MVSERGRSVGEDRKGYLRALADGLALRLGENGWWNRGLALAGSSGVENGLNFGGRESAIVEGDFVHLAFVTVLAAADGDATAEKEFEGGFESQGGKVCLGDAAAVDVESGGSAGLVVSEGDVGPGVGAEQAAGAREPVGDAINVDEIGPEGAGAAAKGLDLGNPEVEADEVVAVVPFDQGLLGGYVAGVDPELDGEAAAGADIESWRRRDVHFIVDAIEAQARPDETRSEGGVAQNRAGIGAERIGCVPIQRPPGGCA